MERQIKKANTATKAIDVIESQESKKRYTIEDIESKLAYLDVSIEKFQESRAMWQTIYDEAIRVTE